MRGFFTKVFHRIFPALTLVHPFNVWLTARKRAQEEADRLALNPGEDTGFIETNELVCLCGIYGPYHMGQTFGSFLMAGFKPNSEIIGKFRKMGKFYDHLVKLQK